MGRHSGVTERASTAVDPVGLDRRSVLRLALGVALTLIAWGLLVAAAIDFGKQARFGEPVAWTFLVLAALGATACLFLALLLGARLVSLLRRAPQPPPRPGGGRRRKLD